MTKKELWSYQNKLKEIARLEQRIKKREADAKAVPTVKTKVQSSQKEFPYTETHITVDAPEPRQYSAIQRDIVLLRVKKAEAEEELLRLDEFIFSVKDELARQILTERYIDHKRLKDVAKDFRMTEQGILKIINQALEGSKTIGYFYHNYDDKTIEKKLNDFYDKHELCGDNFDIRYEVE